MRAATAPLDRIGEYQLLKAIGAGGSARIDLARIDRAFGFQRHVVIKRPLEHLRGDARAMASLRQEARLGGRLRHPNLIAILDAGIHDGYDYLVLEYVHGGSLRSLAQTEPASRVREAPLEVALAIVRDVARGLHAAHELTGEDGAPLGLVHRDVSPGNVLIGLDGSVKLADFGSAKETRVQTLSGSMQGTVTYMAPEQCRGHAFDRRADVWSLGVILYELVTGHRLFFADNDVASLHKVLAGDIPRPKKLKPVIAPALEDIVMTALASDQDKRFTTAHDLAEALELHAGEASAILGARAIQRWVYELIGPRDPPWIGATTVLDMVAPSAEQSLVDLIQAVPDDEAPLSTFGPTAPGGPDDLDTQPRREPTKQRRRRWIGPLAFGLAALGGAGVALLWSDRSSSIATDAAEPARDSTAPAQAGSVKPRMQVEDKPAVVEDKPSDPVTDEPIEMDPAVKADKRKRPTRPAPPKPGSAAVPDEQPVVAEPEPPKPPAGSGSGSGSGTRGKVEWNPTMLLPTDGSKKK